MVKKGTSAPGRAEQMVEERARSLVQQIHQVLAREGRSYRWVGQQMTPKMTFNQVLVLLKVTLGHPPSPYKLAQVVDVLGYRLTDKWKVEKKVKRR